MYIYIHIYIYNLLADVTSFRLRHLNYVILLRVAFLTFCAVDLVVNRNKLNNEEIINHIAHISFITHKNLATFATNIGK